MYQQLEEFYSVTEEYYKTLFLRMGDKGKQLLEFYKITEKFYKKMWDIIENKYHLRYNTVGFKVMFKRRELEREFRDAIEDG